MPIKTVTCCLCGNQVSKRKSFAMPQGGRACETHPEAQKIAEEIRKQTIQSLREVSVAFATDETIDNSDQVAIQNV